MSQSSNVLGTTGGKVALETIRAAAARKATATKGLQRRHDAAVKAAHTPKLTAASSEASRPEALGDDAAALEVEAMAQRRGGPHIRALSEGTQYRRRDETQPADNLSLVGLGSFGRARSGRRAACGEYLLLPLRNVEGDSGANQLFERRFLNRIVFVNVDGPSCISLETRIKETSRVLQRGSLKEG